MFEVSWTDPERETVGERRTRKQQRSACASRNGPPLPPSRGSTSTSTSGDSRPPVMHVFGPSWNDEPASPRRKQPNSSSSTLRIDGPRSRKETSYTASSGSSFQETPRTSMTTTRTPDTEFFSDSYHSDYDQCRLSSQSEGTNSTWSLQAESISSSGKIVQQLSPTSFVTQSTEITVAPRESVKDAEQVAIMVHISASGTVHVHDSAGRRHPQAAILDFLNDNSNSNSNDNPPLLPRESEDCSISSPEKTPQAPSITPVRHPIPWEPPEAWECSKERKDAPPSVKMRGMGLPIRPAKPRRRGGRETADKKAPDE